MKKALGALSLLFLSSSAFGAGAPVQQSGNVTPSHIAKWTTSGVIQDAGTSQVPGVSTLGILSQNQCSFSISTALSPAANTQLCFGITPGATPLAQIGLQSYGGANPGVLDFNINGTIYQFPFAIGGIVGPGTSVIGDVACWNNTVGSLLYDCGAKNSGNVNNGTIDDLAYYAATGNTVSGLPTANNSVLTTDSGGVPSLTAYLSLPNSPSIATSPTGNPTGGLLLPTYSTIITQGTTNNPNNREYLMSVGLVSNLGGSAPNNNGDKVAFYCGVIGNSGTGDIWCLNPLAQRSSGSGVGYNSQVIEVDANNFSGDMGGSDGPGGYPPKVANGISISGVGDSNNYPNTTAIAIDSFNSNTALPMWAHGEGFFGNFKYNEIVDYAQSPAILAAFGGHTYGIDCNGGVFSAACIRLGSGFSSGVVSRDAAGTADAKVLRFDGTNEFVCETNCSGLFINSPIIPDVANTYTIGGPSARWQTLYSQSVDASVSGFVNGIAIQTGTGIAGQCAQWTSATVLVPTGTPCGTGAGGVTSVAAGASGDISVSPTTGAVIVDLAASPHVTSLGVGTSTITSTLTVNGTIGVSSSADFASSLAIHGSVQMTGLSTGTSVHNICINAGNQLILC